MPHLDQGVVGCNSREFTEDVPEAVLDDVVHAM
jgi:hypothetical protein